MTKKELVKKIQNKTGHREEVIVQIVDAVFDEIGNAVTSLETVTITNFGVFEPRQHTGRNTRNPRSGEEVHIPPFVRPWFRASRELKNKVKSGNK